MLVKKEQLTSLYFKNQELDGEINFLDEQYVSKDPLERSSLKP